mmetsp:Transcript_2556/g.2954  ORF Transcript_2556/g.2954 Transcript_2556/m.2954 type:complete len:376 (+) Transcript_2556:110-1237(+)
MEEGRSRGAWTKEEDDRLIQIVQEEGAKRWSAIAKKLRTGRNSKQCRERWSNQINPALVRTKWLPEEDQTIIKAHSTLGNRWALIAKLLPGRTDNMIKNRFNGSLKVRMDRERVYKQAAAAVAARKSSPKREGPSTPSSQQVSVTPAKARTRKLDEESDSWPPAISPSKRARTTNGGLSKSLDTDGKESLSKRRGKEDLKVDIPDKEVDVADVAGWMAFMAEQRDHALTDGTPKAEVLKNIAKVKSEQSWPLSKKPCRCKKSKCLKLYCECFASQLHCGVACLCIQCQNYHGSSEFKGAHLEVITKKPNTFGKRKGEIACNCKSTRCLMKYCDCFRSGFPCGLYCRCVACLNQQNAVFSSPATVNTASSPKASVK